MKNNNYDVVVCGGGIAGVAAAISSARQGMKTVLIEKQCLLGGLATSGLIYIYLPLCDGYGNQVTFGLAEELLRKCTKYSPFSLPKKWGGPENGNCGISGEGSNRYQCCFSPAGYTLVLDQLLMDSGVDLWLDTVLINAQSENGYIKSITVFNGYNTTEITGSCFIDASGGAYLVKLAGGNIIYGENDNTPWVMEKAEDSSIFHFTGSLHVKAIGLPTNNPTVPPCKKGRDITDFVRNSWKKIRERYDKLPESEAKSTYPVHLPAMPQIRKLARIDAQVVLNTGDAGKHFEDSIGVVGDWRKPAPTWETPYGTLLPKGLHNVLAAGRCIGSAGDAWEVYRVIPAAAMTGEAAGVAAALSVKGGISPENLPVKELQKALK